MTEIDFSGATVLSVERGDRLVFVTRNGRLTQRVADAFKANLAEFLPGVEIRLVGGIDEVIVQSGEPVNDIDATGSCCCNGCIGEGPCDLEMGQSDEDSDDLCRCCPWDCQICSYTPDCDCPTHGEDQP